MDFSLKLLLTFCRLRSNTWTALSLLTNRFFCEVLGNCRTEGQEMPWSGISCEEYFSFLMYVSTALSRPLTELATQPWSTLQLLELYRQSERQIRCYKPLGQVMSPELGRGLNHSWRHSYLGVSQILMLSPEVTIWDIFLATY